VVPEFGVGLEVDSQEWHMSPEDHANTLSRGRRIGIHQVIVLRFTPKQIRAEPRQVIEEIRHRRLLKAADSHRAASARLAVAVEDGGAQ
jgi:hypothetical protein